MGRSAFLLASLLLTAMFLPSASARGQSQNAAAAPFRLGIAGLVHDHILGFMNQYLNHPDIAIVGIAEPDRDLAARYAARYRLDPGVLYTDLDEMIEKTHPQAVLIYTNTYDHRRTVEICARHHVDVMMEKPLAVSLADGRAIAESAERGHIHVLVNYETTWYRSNRAAYDLVEQGTLGDLRKVVVHDGHQGPKEIGVGPVFFQWLTDPKLNGAGALYDFGCYGADMMTWLVHNQRPLTVTAVTQQIKPEIYPRVDDEATIILTYPKAQAIIQASWNWPFDRKDMEVYGRTGYVFTVRHDDIRVRREGEDHDQQEAAPPIPAPYDDHLAYLKAVIAGQIPPDGPSSLETNLVVNEILDAARESARTGKTIRLAEE
jgi:predicted dehydrogenase